MKYKLIKKLERKSNGVVYKTLPVGFEVNVDSIEAARLMREGFIADPNAVKKPKKKAKKVDDLGELQIKDVQENNVDKNK